jgi:hypothetical protein
MGGSPEFGELRKSKGRLMRTSLAILSSLALMLSSAGAPAQVIQKLVDVRVQYSLQIPLSTDDIEAQSAAMERGRKMFYEMSGKECALMLGTFSSQCRLEDLNIQSRAVARRRGQEPTLNLTASARFKIELKPEVAGATDPDAAR